MKAAAMHRHTLAALTVLFAAGLAAPALACTQHAGGAHGDHASTALKGVDTPASRAFDRANATMHRDMDITYTGNADADFLRGMIAHHQGAVEMAQVQLQYGRDAQVRRLAMEIIRNQNLEISWMRTWLAQLEHRPAPKPLKLSGWHDGTWPGDTWLGQR